MNGHSALVTGAVEHWTAVKAKIGGAPKPTPLTVVNAIEGLPGVDPAAKAAAGALKASIPAATLHWKQQNQAFNKAWKALGPGLDAAADAAAMIAAIEAAKAGGAPVNLGPAKALVQTGQATVYDAAFLQAHPVPGKTTDLPKLLHSGVKGAVKGVVGANGTPPEAVAVVASLTELVKQLW